MCKSPLHALLHQLPKVEHHIHLEGALSPELLFALARKNKIELPKADPAFYSPTTLAKRYDAFTSLDDFLSYYYIGMGVLVEASDFEALAWDYFQHASADGVLHVEAFFDPQAHLSRGVSYNTLLSGFCAARERARTSLGISSELICCFLRHLPVPEALQTFHHEDVQASFERGDVIAIGLDSSELDYPPELFAAIFERAHALGIKRTAHAGEEGPATYIENALDRLLVHRIDHGVRLANDDQLLRRVAQAGVLLSVCPISNELLRVMPVAQLPIRKFLEHGVQFSINSDDPAYFGANYILANYCAVQEAFQLTVVEWRTICEASIRGSWCEDRRKDEMLARLRHTIERWEGS